MEVENQQILPILAALSNPDWAGDLDKRKLTSGSVKTLTRFLSRRSRSRRPVLHYNLVKLNLPKVVTEDRHYAENGLALNTCQIMWIKDTN